MNAREICVTCGAMSPESTDGMTLTSSTGWRFMRERRPDGTVTAVWRCGPCWKARKASAREGEQTAAMRAVSLAPEAPGMRRRSG